MIAFAQNTHGEFAERIGEIFSARGALSRASNFEYRPQQQQMAIAIARCLTEERHLLVEAGTGVGKSLAYLVPGVLYALENTKKLLVSTHTIPLQQQLLHKDIPTVSKILDMDFRTALLMGRANYLCPQRLKRALSKSGDLFASSQAAELKRIQEWSRHTNTGIRQELQPEPDSMVWSHVCSEEETCNSRHCNPQNCFYQRARANMLEAHVIILNHSLLFTKIGDRNFNTNEEGFLFANDFLVLDEAHTIEDVAARHIGFSVEQAQINFHLRRLYNPITKKGILATLRATKVISDFENVLHAAEHFFNELEHKIEFKTSDEIRIRRPDIIQDTFSAPIALLIQNLTELAKNVQDEDTRSELLEPLRRLRDIRSAITAFLSQSEPEFVYWTAAQRKGPGGRKSISLHAAPVDLAETLRALLFRKNAQTILTSATLSPDRNSLDYIARRIGAEDAEQLQLDSPFDYARQMQVLVPKGLPDPRQEQYIAAISQEVLHHTLRSDGHAFVLFTSARDMRQVAELTEHQLTARGHPVFIQGSELSRDEMLRRFKETPRSILFGLDSFWAGVDVPGEALTNVIITKLPFTPPSQPQFEARCELIEKRGGNSFRDLSLPEAVLKFRQGAGRLIRSSRDYGTLVILDSRITKKYYGKSFLSALPHCQIEFCEAAFITEEKNTRY